MIIIVDDRGSVTEAFRSSFSREGIPAAGFSYEEFEGWVEAADEQDVGAIEAFIIGECDFPANLASIVRRRCTAAVIAMRDQRSLAATLELFAGGVDDVVSKPCHVREIMARIEAIARRARAVVQDGITLGDIHVYRDGRPPIVGGAPLPLPRRELRILEFLVNRERRRVTKSQIASAVYGLFENDVDENVIESHISKLRRRLRERLGYDPIDTKRYLGYQLLLRSSENRIMRVG